MARNSSTLQPRWMDEGAEGFAYLEIAIAILAFVLLGKFIEETVRSSAASVQKLLELKPTTAEMGWR